MLHSISTLGLMVTRGMVTDTTKIRWEVAYMCVYRERQKYEFYLCAYIFACMLWNNITIVIQSPKRKKTHVWTLNKMLWFLKYYLILTCSFFSFIFFFLINGLMGENLWDNSELEFFSLPSLPNLNSSLEQRSY